MKHSIFKLHRLPGRRPCNPTFLPVPLAANETSRLTAVGAIQNNQDGTAIYGSGARQILFDGIAPGLSDILAACTYHGDANLDGKVNGSDYCLIDYSFNKNLTGWLNGDFNYDGNIDGSDYTLIDNSFLNQSSTLANATATAELSVPEPAMVGAIFCGLAALGRRGLSRNSKH